jgi:hypothetical protein
MYLAFGQYRLYVFYSLVMDHISHKGNVTSDVSALHATKGGVISDVGYVGQIHPALKIEMFLQRRNC